MRLKRKSVKKLASLSAFGAGALVLGAQEADASVIYSAVNQKVGWGSGPGFTSSYHSPSLGGLSAFSFFRSASVHTTLSSRTYGYRKVQAALRSGILSFAKATATLALFPAGAKWSTVVFTNGSNALVARRQWTVSGGHSQPGLGSFSNQYSLIKFSCPAGTCYGWIQLSLSVNDAAGQNDADGPGLTIIGYAYDDTGAQLASGDAGVPEPDTFAMTGLAALALGALGLRRWRAARPS